MRNLLQIFSNLVLTNPEKKPRLLCWAVEEAETPESYLYGIPQVYELSTVLSQGAKLYPSDFWNIRIFLEESQGVEKWVDGFPFRTHCWMPSLAGEIRVQKEAL